MVEPLRLARTLTRTTRSFFGGAAYHVNLNSICASVNYGCMGLPKELIDYIIDMLYDNKCALKACSLTCRAMFASTRRLIHEKLHLTELKNRGILTRGERLKRFLRLGRYELRFLSYVGERGLLQYTQEVDIRNPAICTPESLLPHLRHFQSMRRVHTLAIMHYHAGRWADHYKTCFAHFYPTLTSLTLRHPFGNYRAVLQFALQFPNLKDLCLEVMVVGVTPEPDVPIPVEQASPLRGRLRLIGYGTTSQWPEELAHELPHGFNFRCIELEAFSGTRVQHILRPCAHTLEDLVIIPHNDGYYQLRGLIFTVPAVLRRLIIRITFSQLFILERSVLLEALSTITSSAFREFVFEVCALPTVFEDPSCMHWGYWGEVEKFLISQWGKLRDFRLVVRASGTFDTRTFQRHAREAFPLLSRRGHLRYESASEPIEKFFKWPS